MQDRMKIGKITKNIILSILFVGLLAISMMRIFYVMREKENTNIWDNFNQLEEDSVDLVFIGTSHQFCTIDPDLLYEEYGIESFMLATSAQTVPMSYYAAKQAIEDQHPECIVMEVLYCGNDFRTVTPEMSHTFFDGMPLGEVKKEAIDDLIPKEEQIYFYLNFGRYHSRWKELSETDFQSNLTAPRGGYHSEVVSYNWQIPVISREETEPIPDEMLKYMDKLIALCKDQDVKLILYVAPFNSMYDEDGTRVELFQKQRMYNWLENYVTPQGIEFHNLFYELDKLGLDGNTDYMDSQHLNCFGQAKVTRYMAEKGYFGMDE